LAGRRREASFLNHAREGFKVLDPVHDHSPAMRKRISPFSAIITAGPMRI
jgi:hypothetical protein